MTVAAIMRRNFIAVNPEETLEEARQTMRMARLRHLLVTRDHLVVGILSYREILESLLARMEGLPLDTATVGESMKPAPAFATTGTSLAEAADRMCRYGVGCLPVLEAGPGTSPEASSYI